MQVVLYGDKRLFYAVRNVLVTSIDEWKRSKTGWVTEMVMVLSCPDAFVPCEESCCNFTATQRGRFFRRRFEHNMQNHNKCPDVVSDVLLPLD